MPTFSDPVADADEAREAIRSLAHGTRSIEHPASIYPVLGSISTALASLSQTLHQLGDVHDDPAIRSAWINGDSRADSASSYRACSYRVSWELHRAAEMVNQVAAAVDRAHEIEATIDHPLARSTDRSLAGARGPVHDRGMSL